MGLQDSGSSTPLSSTTTLSQPSLPPYKSGIVINITPFNNPRIPASNVVEYIASRPENSAFVYIYDVAEQVGFGTLTKEWSNIDTTAKIVDLQTRAGAGLSLIGRLSQGTSVDAASGNILTAYTTPTGLTQMAPSFSYLPHASSAARLVIHVPTVTPIGETLALSPTLSPLASIWNILPENVAVLLSSTPQQIADFADLSYRISDFHIIHLFDHYSASREMGHELIPLVRPNSAPATIHAAIKDAGYQFFEYHGDATAKTVIVILNSPLALILKAALKNSDTGLGVIIVNVLRPWDEAAIRAIVPSSVTTVRVLDDVPNSVTQGSLYVDVFGALWNANPNRVVKSHRVIPSQTQHFIQTPTAFLQFINNLVGSNISAPAPSSAKKVLIFGVPDTSLAAFPALLEELFLKKAGILSRLLTDHDVFSKPGGINANRLIISRKDTGDFLPIPFVLPLDTDSHGHSDFLGIFDQGLLKTHSLLKHAKTESTVVITTLWLPAEFLATISQDDLTLIRERDLSVYTIDAKAIAANLVGAAGPHYVSAQNLLLEIVFLRLYLGAAATEETVLQLARTSFDDHLNGVSLSKFNSHAWSSLRVVDVPTTGETPSDVTPTDPPILKDFEANAIAVETTGGNTVVNGARLSSWHDAAKHLIFPSVFAPSQDDNSSQNPALRPEVPETTFLVACTVNKRLTPLEYDRNVFHLEFDTSNTGLKYDIGEALGIHGWNDEQEVLDFCAWYGVDPDRLITIPVPTDESKMHTRTILQALQQQIDLFGRPPKSFYTDIAEYASGDVDRYALRFIGSPEGVSTFKKLSEKDTVTFADVLKKYKTARPGIERLCELIGDIKPRHYSIASAQSVVGDRVDLLVVTVDWATPEGASLYSNRYYSRLINPCIVGTPRYGQCTRYLANLKIGQKVTVSIKPSVMKVR